MASLYDTAVRHQLLMEGLKEYQLGALAGVFAQMERDLRVATYGLEAESLDRLTRRQLTRYLNTLEDIQAKAYGRYVRSLMAFLRQYLEADRVILNRVIAAETDNTYIAAPVIATLVKVMQDGTLPANGMTVEGSLTALLSSSVHSLRQQVMVGVANQETPQQLAARIRGTSERGFKNGLTNSAYNQMAALVRTIMQGAFAALREAVYRLYTDRYMWSSVIDSQTTDICRSRNGRVYVYGQGPKPPAHYNCRSTTVPVMVRETPPAPSDNWFDWISRQPEQLWADILPLSVYNGLKSGQFTARDLPKFDRAKSFSIEGYRRRAGLLTA